MSGTWNLRSRRSWKHIERAFFGAMAHSGARICEFSVMGDHVHMLVEAHDRVALSSAMRSFGISVARRLNRMRGTRGRVLADRYHARDLRSPNAVRRARDYVLGNHKKHFGATWLVDSYSSLAFDGFPEPETTLLYQCWKRGSPLPYNRA